MTDAPDQPRPTEHAEQEGTCSHCGAEVSPWPNREHRCLLSDLRKPQHAPSGEHQHSWAYDKFAGKIACYDCGVSGWDWSVDRIRDLEADLAQRTAELERAGQLLAGGWSVDQVRAQVQDFNGLADYLNRIADALGCDNPQIIERITEVQAELAQVWQQRDQYLAELQRLRVVNQEYADLANTEQVHAANLAEQWRQAQAEFQQTRAVVEAARAYVAWWDEPLRPRLTEAWSERLRAMERALDHSPAVGEAGRDAPQAGS